MVQAAAASQPSEWIGRALAELETPALVLDAAAFDANIARMADDCRRLGKALRPHAKAHKSPIVARRQIEAGAVGITCAKISEAEVMVDGGVADILVSTIVGSPAKASRTVRLAGRAGITAVVDSSAGATWLSEAAVAAGLIVPVLIDVDVGQRRTAVEPGAPTRALAEVVARLPGLELRGLQGYEGHLQHTYDLDQRRARVAASMELLRQARAAVEQAGLEVSVVSTAGTGTYQLAGACDWVTELQPGSYIVMDADYDRVEGLGFVSALSVASTVLGVYADHATVDAGNKSLSTDAGSPKPKALPGYTFSTAGDEHGRLVREDGALDLAIGAIVELLPSHCDTTVNLHDTLFVVRDDRVEDVWPILARGCVQ